MARGTTTSRSRHGDAKKSGAPQSHPRWLRDGALAPRGEAGVFPRQAGDRCCPGSEGICGRSRGLAWRVQGWFCSIDRWSGDGVRGLRLTGSARMMPVVLKGRFGVFPILRPLDASCRAGARNATDVHLIRVACRGYSACVVFVPRRGGARYSETFPLSEGGR